MVVAVVDMVVGMVWVIVDCVATAVVVVISVVVVSFDTGGAVQDDKYNNNEMAEINKAYLFVFIRSSPQYSAQLIHYTAAHRYLSIFIRQGASVR